VSLAETNPKTEKPVLRTKSIGTKVSNEEYARLEELAKGRGVTLGEWFREVLLGELEQAVATAAEETVLAEVLALRTILLNVQYALARGEHLSAEEMRVLIERADQEKLRKAVERLTASARARDGQ
jgi:mobilization protein NikA